MENIDDLMRQKFDSDNPGERFEFQEEYWAQAQILLEQMEERRRKRWWLFLVLLLCLGCGTWALLAHGWSGAMGAKEKENQEKNIAQIVDNQTNIKNSPTAPLSTQPLQPSDGTLQKPEQIATPSVGESFANTSKNTLEPAQNSLKTLHPADSKTVQTPKTPTPQTSAKVGAINATNTSSRANQNQSRPTQASEMPATVEKTVETPSAPSINALPMVPVADSQAVVVSPAAIPTVFLPIVPIYLTLPTRSIFVKKQANLPQKPIAQQKNPSQDARFSLGFSVAASAQQPDTSGPWAGWVLGAYGRYHFGTQWSLQLGGQWRFLPHVRATTDPTGNAPIERISYSFGYTDERWVRETRGLHSIEMPLSLGWKKGRWGLEAGALAGVLFFVANRTEYTVRTSLDESPQTTVQKGLKGDRSPFNPSYFAAFVGAEYHVTQRFALFSRANYRFTPLLTPAEASVNNNGFGQLELGLRFRAF